MVQICVTFRDILLPLNRNLRLDKSSLIAELIASTDLEALTLQHCFPGLR